LIFSARIILGAEAALIPVLIRRDIHVAKVPNKAVAVVAMHRTGEAIFLRRRWLTTQRLACP